jgi:hypothetical protein
LKKNSAELRSVSDAELFILLKVELIKSQMKEIDAEAFAKVLVAARKEGLFTFVLDVKDGNLDFWINADNEHEALKKLREWTVKHHAFGNIADGTYEDMLLNLNRLMKIKYPALFDEKA